VLSSAGRPFEFHSSIWLRRWLGSGCSGIALGYEDIKDHDELRHDPLMAVLAGKLEARRRPTDWV
jgi:hypothetical protein